MPFYAVAYGSHEDSDIVYFEHSNNYTYQEFEEITIKAIVELLKRMKSGELEQMELQKWPSIHNISDLFPSCIKRALEPFGFRVVETHAKVVFSGWQDPFYLETKWYGKDDETAKLIAALRESGFTKKDSSSYAYKEKRMRRRKERHEESRKEKESSKEKS